MKFDPCCLRFVSPRWLALGRRVCELVHTATSRRTPSNFNEPAFIRGISSNDLACHVRSKARLASIQTALNATPTGCTAPNSAGRFARSLDAQALDDRLDRARHVRFTNADRIRRSETSRAHFARALRVSKISARARFKRSCGWAGSGGGAGGVL